MSTTETRSQPARAQPLGGGRGVVEVAGTTEEGGAGVMAGRAHGRVGRPNPVGYEVGGVRRGVNRAAHAASNVPSLSSVIVSIA